MTLEQAWALALEHHRSGRLPEAETICRQVLSQQATFAPAWNLLGTIAMQVGKAPIAIDLISRAIALEPGTADFRNSLGNALQQAGRPDLAITSYQAALELNPQSPSAHANLGEALRVLGRLDEAVTSLEKAVQLKPDFAAAHNNLGNVRRAQGQIDSSIVAYQRAIELQPGFAQAHHNLGVALIENHQVDDAIAAHRRAVELQPDWALAHYNLGIALLQKGDFAAGWTEHEWRLSAPELAGRHEIFAQPQWDGSELGRRTILIHTEQGFGDAIQFARYVPLVASRGGRVILRCQPELLGLFSRIEGIDRCIARGEEPPGFDVHCPLLSLPLRFGTTLDTIPVTIPYLRADSDAASRWRERIGSSQKRIGISWAGRSDPEPRRSLPPDALAPLMDLPNLRFFSLQKSPPTPATAILGKVIDWTDDLTDFAETAALIDNLDLVITIDTAVAHLAGAMGKPVWVLLPYSADWRWMVDRDDSPWYPSMRLFRQPAPGDWETPIAQVVQALRGIA